VRDHLLPALGDWPVCELKPLEVDAYLSSLASAGRKRVRKGESEGLSSRTIHHHYSVLCQAFAWAVKKKLIDYTQNPMTAVDAPQVQEAERHAMSNTELASLLKAARDTSLFIPIVLAATTGARRGEIVGLTWDSVDLDKEVIHIRQALTRVKGVTTVKQPKSKSSKATLVLLDEATNVLKVEQERQGRREAHGDGWRNLHNLVCPARDGDYANPESISAKFCSLRDRLVKSGQLSAPYTLHDLRHYHLTEYQRQSKDLVATRARGRHASLQMTDHYVHSSLDEQRRIVGELDATIGAALRRASRADGTHMAPLRLVK
jgi:integrase